ncbi:sulfatase-like hydrolase/transferase [Microbulbifer sp. 2205BS26-8]|uniref:sulfatase-like hydrolase/transferase n=1 Tax=Microbulbifer sp. 2205BS26-8 TaxID=3064386 RepID=UPI00273D67F3|nr:sulfatase-like hydrolase/transferase [Microbulbifer sp. 2205BS26-8]MDP5209000.1 sulfatase-like hydrolase/transferase [Microbulbifer sp. 2205BS26-8]
MSDLKKAVLLSFSLVFSCWISFVCFQLFNGGNIGVETSSETLDRVWEYFTVFQFSKDIACFVFVQFGLCLVWGSIILFSGWGLKFCIPALGWGVALFIMLALSAGIILSLNSILYPLSIFTFPIASLPVLNIILFFSIITLLVLFLFGIRIVFGVRVFLGIPVVLVAFFAVEMYGQFDVSGNAQIEKDSKPNVFIIGVDAMRPDKLGYFGAEYKLTPNIDSLLEQGEVFSRAYTPVARTQVAWSGVLTGKYPLNNGVRFNLMENEYIQKESFITFDLTKSGYRTIWALDERRFNNIDESYSFDKALGPKVGAADFVITYLSDNPLVNLLGGSFLGDYIFPYIYNNRGNFITYVPYNFNDEIVSAVGEGGGAVFVAAHFCLPHYPFLNNLMPDLERDYPGIREKAEFGYLSMLRLVDKQVGDLIEKLSKAGALDNALVYLISDHGESFHVAEDGLIQGNPAAVFTTNIGGHGTSVLLKSQSQVVLAKIRFNKGVPKSPILRVNERLSSLVDIAPDIFYELNLDWDDGRFDGLPLSESIKDRVIYLESSYSINAISGSRVDAVAALNDAIDGYRVGKDGRLYYSKSTYPETLKAKQRAAIHNDSLVAIFPDEKNYFFYVDLKENKWWPGSVDTPFDIGGKNWRLPLLKLCEFYRNDPYFDNQAICNRLTGKNH